MFLFFFLISQALLCVSTVSHLLNSKLSLRRLSVLHIFVNSVKLLSMHMQVCVPPFLPLRQENSCVTVNDPLGREKTCQGSKCVLDASLYHLPHLCLVSVATVVYVGTQQSSLSWALYLSLLNKLELFLLSVLLE